jgi:2-polyprenyl-6-methoxyphenol hydroxylase-like FAD-dependent oxidoreductase
MRIAVVGGSLAGLFTATLLARDGHDVSVYERSVRGLEGRGAGLLGKRETFAILRASGCEHVARVGVVARERIVFEDSGFIGAVSDGARRRLVDDADRLLPRSFAAAIRATVQPFVQGIFDYETKRMASRRIALAGDAAFVVRPHTGMGIAKAAPDALALRKYLSSTSLGDALRNYGQERAQTGAAIAAAGREMGAHLE